MLAARSSKKRDRDADDELSALAQLPVELSALRAPVRTSPRTATDAFAPMSPPKTTSSLYVSSPLSPPQSASRTRRASGVVSPLRAAVSPRTSPASTSARTPLRSRTNTVHSPLVPGKASAPTTPTKTPTSSARHALLRRTERTTRINNNALK
jgi:hypothetical protein